MYAKNDCDFAMQTFNIHSKIHRKWPDPNDPNELPYFLCSMSINGKRYRNKT